MNKKRSVKFEEAYFKGNSSTYRKNYDYKVGNIALVYKENAEKLLKKYVPVGARILDLACAFGDLLSLLDKSNYKTYGIDISEYALKQAKKNTSAQLIQGDLNKILPYKSNYFDSVFAFDIIEHVDSPYKFLQEIQRILKKNGIVFIQTPNINSIFEKITKDKWFGYSDETHLHLFSRKSLKFLLKQSGFLIMENQTFTAPFPPLIRSLVKNTDIGGNLWVVGRKV